LNKWLFDSIVKFDIAKLLRFWLMMVDYYSKLEYFSCSC